ncbi:MoaA/NifB/PqqE/SkfB family radical SAM enzyme [Pontibacter ummariensis]|uniref:Radical SAM superfamily enzyme, MoaA/NifB/PqqE/SkfB family n=1 Tax=Pontibacter ummariensis TaxID=1610492 RepID=A0A239HRM3_9BACT|nr:radical SAM protein [Pontibacter ummariensis]PRY10398.1 MoaA/NifB/PqqE/SkfB family radical SAM enzyme [Pontibacter ummariensis]SNS83881.1 Radical SAM superfamily enzyme, MoaA/NifB/PqqE/SkfB family [Pontibacter ummariensis]
MRLTSRPVLCNYYVTYRCNAKCSFCDIWEKPSPYITLEDVAQNLRDLKRLGVQVIDFTGGEPLLHRQIDAMLGMAHDMGFITTLTTNGMLYPKLAERLKGKVDMLHFSLDSADREEHDTGRGVPCYDLVMKSIEVAKELRERPDILFTVFRKNLHQLEEVYQKIILPNKLLLIINPAFEYNEVETGENLTPEELDYLAAFGRRPQVYLNEGFVELRRDGGNHVEKPVCKAASTTLVISPENELVLPCYHLGTKRFPIKGNLLALYRSQEVAELKRQEGRLPACEGCTINCYMQPSFAVEVNKYFWKALPSTLKYNYMKGTWKRLLPFSK